jgi:hypothetical protein
MVTNRTTITYTVKVKNRKLEDRWLQPDGTLGDQDSAVEFTVLRSPTPAERHAIELGMHRLSGGLSEWIDLEQGIDTTRRAILSEIEAELWPEERPKVEGAELLAQQEQIAEAWRRLDPKSNLMAGLSVMLSLRDRLQFMASWPVLIQNPPAGWDQIADREDLDEDQFAAIWSAHIDATTAASLEQQRSSAP